MRRAAAETLGEIGDSRAVDPLIQRLLDTDENWLVRHTAAEALGKIGDGRAIEALLETIDGKGIDLIIIKSAALALGKIADKKAVKPLVKMLDHFSSLSRYGAAVALGKIRDGEAVDPLIQRLLDNEEDIMVRVAAAEALGEIGDRRALSALEIVLREIETRQSIAFQKIIEKKLIEPLVQPIDINPFDPTKKNKKMEIKNEDKFFMQKFEDDKWPNKRPVESFGQRFDDLGLQGAVKRAISKILDKL